MMAQRTIVQLTDDLDGKPIPDGKGETIRFGLDRTDYEIDLADKNAKALRDTFAKYVSAARRTGGGRASPAAMQNIAVSTWWPACLWLTWSRTMTQGRPRPRRQRADGAGALWLRLLMDLRGGVGLPGGRTGQVWVRMRSPLSAAA